MSRQKVKTRRKPKTGVSLRGFFRLELVDHKTGRVRGRTPWIENTVTNNGLNGIAACILGTTGSWQVSGLVLAEQSDFATSDLITQISLASTIPDIQTGGDLTLSSQGTGTARILATFSGADHNSTYTIRMLGVHAHTSANATNSLMACQSFDSSEFASDQDVNATYELRFANT